MDTMTNSEAYANLSACYDVLNHISKPLPEGFFISQYTGGWKISVDTITSTGIDIDEIYEFIKYLVILRKNQVETQLDQINQEK